MPLDSPYQHQENNPTENQQAAATEAKIGEGLLPYRLEPCEPLGNYRVKRHYLMNNANEDGQDGQYAASCDGSIHIVGY